MHLKTIDIATQIWKMTNNQRIHSKDINYNIRPNNISPMFTNLQF
jgi:hypothetical protein